MTDGFSPPFWSSALLSSICDLASSGEDAKPERETYPRVLKFIIYFDRRRRPDALAGLQRGGLPESLEFANGPYSAKAIEQKTATVNPAKGNLLAAGSYF